MTCMRLRCGEKRAVRQGTRRRAFSLLYLHKSWCGQQLQTLLHW